MLVWRIFKRSQTRQGFHDFFTLFSLGVTNKDMATSSMSWNRPIISLALTLTVALGSTLATADEFRADLIARLESDGGRNIPNFRYTGPNGKYTAGGVCQMTNKTWQRIAPTVDIDLNKFPVAGAASEFQQWQACWKLWSLEGYRPWTCDGCNTKLRKMLTAAESRGDPRPQIPPQAEVTVTPRPHDWDVFPEHEAEPPQPTLAPTIDAAPPPTGQDTTEKSETDEK